MAGRKSKLSEEQWAQIDRKRLSGVAVRVLAKEFGITESAIRQRKTSHITEIKTLANQLVRTEDAIKALPISAQISTHDHAAYLRSISSHLAGAANYGSATAHRLAGIAHSKVQEIDDAAPLNEESMEALKGVAVLTRMANDAASTGLNLLNANKEQAKAPSAPAGLGYFYGEQADT